MLKVLRRSSQLRQQVLACRRFTDKPIQLLESPRIDSVSVVQALRNIVPALSVRLVHDRSFNVVDFLLSSKEAACVVAKLLSTGQFDQLKDLVTDDVIAKLKSAYYKLDDSSKHWLEVNDDDIYKALIHSINIIKSSKEDRVWVEIMCVFEGCHGFRPLRDESTFQKVLEYMVKSPYKHFTMNYRFIREYTQNNANNEWTVNALNHFHPHRSISLDQAHQSMQ